MLQVNHDAAEREREEYLEDVRIAGEREAEERKYKLKLTKLEVAGKHKYKTAEKFLVALAKCLPWCLCVMAVFTLTLLRREVPPALEDFLK
jgi:hypothetical protein